MEEVSIPQKKQYCQRTGKICYSRKDANETISFFKRGHRNHKWGHRGKQIPQRSYYCEYCKAYHLTHYKN